MRTRKWLGVALVFSLATVVPTAWAQQAKPVKLALIGDRTGPLEAYAKQLNTGFKMGLEYATKGTNTVAGRKSRSSRKTVSSSPTWAAACSPKPMRRQRRSRHRRHQQRRGPGHAAVAQDYKKLLIVDGAVADSITGDKWNRYIFRVDRNSSQDAISNGLTIGKPGVVVATLAQDYAFGRDGIAAFRTALESTGAKLVHEEYAPPTTTDFTALRSVFSTPWPSNPARKSCSCSGPVRTPWPSSARSIRRASASSWPPAATFCRC